MTWTEEEISQRNNNLFTLIFTLLRRETTPRVGLVILPSCQKTFQEIRNQYAYTPYDWLFKHHAVDLRTSKAPIQELIGAITGQQWQVDDSSREVIETQNTPQNQRDDSGDDLSSETGVNYTQLRDFLKAGQWKEADEETLAVMLKATGREKEGWLSSESIENFPCTDLRTIDQLWVKYSERCFGFSVQKRIWESVGKDEEKFGDRVGWRKQKILKWKFWLDYSELTFTNAPKNAPNGHLPARIAWRVETAGYPVTGNTAWVWHEFFSWAPREHLSSLASRLVNCNI
ncbi:MAG: GUN4 domain-containing protein [Scytonema hyalinum WJT4-NPBG1]|nr:GUN4 domain-containing protein [Scytonema hyalinum WJT4-NPBG1]